MPLKLNRRAVLKGIAGASLALPVLDAMGSEVAEQRPNRFCALYTANGMSLPKAENKIDEWSWFPTSKLESGPFAGQFEFGKSTQPLSPFREHVSFMGLSLIHI